MESTTEGKQKNDKELRNKEKEIVRIDWTSDKSCDQCRTLEMVPIPWRGVQTELEKNLLLYR